MLRFIGNQSENFQNPNGSNFLVIVGSSHQELLKKTSEKANLPTSETGEQQAKDRIDLTNRHDDDVLVSQRRYVDREDAGEHPVAVQQMHQRTVEILVNPVVYQNVPLSIVGREVGACPPVLVVPGRKRRVRGGGDLEERIQRRLNDSKSGPFRIRNDFEL